MLVDFFFLQYFKDVAPMSSYLVSDEKSTVILIFVSLHVMCLRLKIFSLSVFKQFNYDIPWWDFLLCSCVQDS